MKNIILLSDGTGNSSSSNTKTNVWRLYQALDLREPANGAVRQVAFYDDGVGTSGFRPLMILGSVFGWGLKRNVFDLYQFLCRNYQPGDRIFAFGFSRGAFTIRILVALIVSQGIARCDTDSELTRATADAYRAFRAKQRNTTGSPLIRLGRGIRNGAVRFKRWVCDQRYHDHAIFPRPADGHETELDNKMVTFVGVWDTVAAYGLPFSELTRGWDQVVWPLSMSENILSPKVALARHALSLDDERDTFHPVLWDEVGEQQQIERGLVKAGRLRQVWFSGMHADVGGGYPDDGISMAPLLWMIGETRGTGLRFLDSEVGRFEAQGSRSAPMHDSRRGVGGAYRYQPRRIDAWMKDPYPGNLIMRDPYADVQGSRLDPKPWRVTRESHGALIAGLVWLIRGDPEPMLPLSSAVLTSVTIHHSAIQRIRDGHAPIVLPGAYAVEGGGPGDPLETPEQAAARAEAQEAVWNDVWRRRLCYYLMLAVAFGLLFLPLRKSSYSGEPCLGMGCAAEPFIRSVGALLPAFLDTWINAFALNPVCFLGGIFVLGVLLARSAKLQARIRDRMTWRWRGAPGEPPSVGCLARITEGWIKRSRTAPRYQAVMRKLKWRILPGVFGYGVLVAAVFGAWVGVSRFMLSSAEKSGEICKIEAGYTGTKPPMHKKDGLFSPRAICWDADVHVKQGVTYEVKMVVREEWQDGKYTWPTNPSGFWTSQHDWHLRPFVPFTKRSSDGKWFQPFITIIKDRKNDNPQGVDKEPKQANDKDRNNTEDKGPRLSMPLEMAPLSDGKTFVARFKAPVGGSVLLWVNDGVIDLRGYTGSPGLTASFYDNNRKGTAEVTITEVQPVATDKDQPVKSPPASR